jgi:hypothetical protein
MNFATFFFALCFLFVQADPVELTPVDAGVADATPLSESLQLQPYDLRANQSFEQLFRVEGSPEIYVRRAGSLHAVFRDPLYDQRDGALRAVVPTGTIYCIGEVTREVLNQLGVIATGEDVGNTQRVSDNETTERWNPPPPKISHPNVQTFRFLDDERYRRRRLATFVLELSITH